MEEILKLLEAINFFQFIKTNLIKILISLVIFLILKYLKKYFDKILKSVLKKSGTDLSISTFLISLFSIFYYAFVIYMLMGLFGINMSSIAAFVGVSGVLFGLVFKEMLANFSGGIIILTFKPFKVGDSIEFKDYIGDVTSIELFYTKIKNPQNELIIVPNGIITNNELRNMTKEGIRRLDLKVGVAYNSDVKKVKSILLSIVENLKQEKKFDKDGVYILDNPESVVGINELGDSAIIFNVNVYVKIENYTKMRYLLNEAIKIRLDEEKIEIPFPQMDVYLKNN